MINNNGRIRFELGSSFIRRLTQIGCMLMGLTSLAESSTVLYFGQLPFTAGSQGTTISFLTDASEIPLSIYGYTPGGQTTEQDLWISNNLGVGLTSGQNHSINPAGSFLQIDFLSLYNESVADGHNHTIRFIFTSVADDSNVRLFASTTPGISGAALGGDFSVTSSGTTVAVPSLLNASERYLSLVGTEDNGIFLTAISVTDSGESGSFLIPEPGTGSLLCSGLFGCLLVRACWCRFDRRRTRFRR